MPLILNRDSALPSQPTKLARSFRISWTTENPETTSHTGHYPFHISAAISMKGSVSPLGLKMFWVVAISRILCCRQLNGCSNSELVFCSRAAQENLLLIFCSGTTRKHRLRSELFQGRYWRMEAVLHALPQAKRWRGPQPNASEGEYQDTTKPKKPHIASILIEDRAGDHRIFRSEMIVALASMREQMRIKENQNHCIFPVSPYFLPHLEYLVFIDTSRSSFIPSLADEHASFKSISIAHTL